MTIQKPRPHVRVNYPAKPKAQDCPLKAKLIELIVKKLEPKEAEKTKAPKSV